MIFQDFPGPGIFKKKIQDFPEGVGTLKQTNKYQLCICSHPIHSFQFHDITGPSQVSYCSSSVLQKSCLNTRWCFFYTKIITEMCCAVKAVKAAIKACVAYVYGDLQLMSL